jgi:hypothetical protein
MTKRSNSKKVVVQQPQQAPTMTTSQPIVIPQSLQLQFVTSAEHQLAVQAPPPTTIRPLSTLNYDELLGISTQLINERDQLLQQNALLTNERIKMGMQVTVLSQEKADFRIQIQEIQNENTAQITDAHQKIKELQEENERLRTENKLLQDEIDTLKSRLQMVEEAMDMREMCRHLEGLMYSEIVPEPLQHNVKYLGMLIQAHRNPDARLHKKVEDSIQSAGRVHSWAMDVPEIHELLQELKDDGNIFAHQDRPLNPDDTFESLFEALERDIDPGMPSKSDFLDWLTRKRADLLAPKKKKVVNIR